MENNSFFKLDPVWEKKFGVVPEAIFWGNVCYELQDNDRYRIYMTYVVHGRSGEGAPLPIGRGEVWLDEVFEGTPVRPSREVLEPYFVRTREIVYGK